LQDFSLEVFEFAESGALDLFVGPQL